MQRPTRSVGRQPPHPKPTGPLVAAGSVAVALILLLVIGVKLAHHSSGSQKTTTGTGHHKPGGTTSGKGHTGVTVTTPTNPLITQGSGSGQPTGIFTNSRVAGWMNSRSGILTAAVYDLKNGQLSLWKPDQTKEYAASVVKVDILADLLYQSQGRAQNLNSTQETLAKAMIEQSSDSAATTLFNEIGGPSKLNSFNRLIGMHNTVANKHWGATTTSAQDQLVLLQALTSSSSILNSTSRSYELSLMQNVAADQSSGITYGAPKGATISLKNGWLQLTSNNWQVNSIGSVSGGGADYLIAVLTSGSASEQYGVGTIEGLSVLTSPLMVTARGTTNSSPSTAVQGQAGTPTTSKG